MKARIARSAPRPVDAEAFAGPEQAEGGRASRRPRISARFPAPASTADAGEAADRPPSRQAANARRAHRNRASPRPALTAMTMNTTSSPSSSTALKLAIPASQSSRALRERRSRSCNSVCLVGKRRRFVVQRNESGGAQNRLAQPAHAEQEQQNADGDLQHVKRHAVEQRPERNDNQRQYGKPARGAPSTAGRTPRTDRDGEHNGQRFDRLDQRRQKRRGDRRSGMQTDRSSHISRE